MNTRDSNSSAPTGLDKATRWMLLAGLAVTLLGAGLTLWKLLAPATVFVGEGIATAVLISGLAVIALGFSRATGRWSCRQR